MDRKLLDILVCPDTRQPLVRLDQRGLEALNRAIARHSVNCMDGAMQTDAIREALITRDGKTVYRIDDGIPVLLVEEGMATSQIGDFPRA